MEIACTITERLTQKRGVTYYRPAGSIIVGLSDRQIKQKWCEIICVLCSPYEKYRKIYGNWTYYTILNNIWKKSLYDAYWSFERKKLALDDLWSEIISDGNVISVLPNEPLNKCHITQTWFWSDNERRQFFLSFMDESTMTNEQKYKIAEHGGYEINGGKFFGALNRIDFEADINLSSALIEDLKNPNKIVHPDLDRKLDYTKVKRMNGLLEIHG